MKQLTNFKLYIFRGFEVDREKNRGPLREKPVFEAESWYVGHEPGWGVCAGPFESEARATSEAYAMTNTSGT